MLTAEEVQAAGNNTPIAYMGEDGIAVYRASAVTKCIRALVASRLGHTPMSPPDSMQQRFDEGHIQEPIILARIQAEDYGWTLSGDAAQTTVDIPVGEHIVIRGHIDEVGTHPEYGMCIIEAKALSESGYKKWLAQGFDAFPYYFAQAACYSWGLDLPIAMAVKNKSSGDIDVKVLKFGAVSLGPIKAHVAKAEAIARTGKLPDCDKNDYPCAFYYLHDEREQDNKEVGIASANDQAIAESLIAEYVKWQAVEVKAKADKDEARTKLLCHLDQAGVDEVGTASGRAVRTTQIRKQLDKKMMAADGINVEQYEVPQETVVLRVTAAEVGA